MKNSKFIQIAVNPNHLYALDKDGGVWEYDVIDNSKPVRIMGWIKRSDRRLLTNIKR